MSFKDLPIMKDKKRVCSFFILMFQRNLVLMLKKNLQEDGLDKVQWLINLRMNSKKSLQKTVP